MSLPRFFLEHQIIVDETAAVFNLRLSEADVRHAKALRLKPGEHLAVIDAAGDYFECRVESCSSDALSVSITAKQATDATRPTVILVQGIAKGEKMDTVIRQGTELGVCGFIPFLCERSVVRMDARKAEAKTERWRTIAKNAAMQSGQLSIPEVSMPMDLSKVCEFISQAHVVAICWEEERTAAMKDLIYDALEERQVAPADALIVVIVGPEGGLTAEEVDALCAANRYSGKVTLGPAILRTETAGVLAPAFVLYELGGFA